MQGPFWFLGLEQHLPDLLRAQCLPVYVSEGLQCDPITSVTLGIRLAVLGARGEAEFRKQGSLCHEAQ